MSEPEISANSTASAAAAIPPAGKPAGFSGLVKKVAAQSAIYTLGTALQNVGALLLIPVYWRFLEPSDFGVLAITGMVNNFLVIFLGLAVSENVTRFYHEWPAAERRERLGSIWILDWSSSLVVGIPVALFGGYAAHALINQVAWDPYIRVAVWAAIFSSFSSTPLAVLRIEERPKAFIFCTLSVFIIRTALAIWFVVGRGSGCLGVLEADLYSALAMLPVYFLILLRSARFTCRVDQIKAAVRFSFPLVPAGLFDGLLLNADRFVLEKFIPLGQLGLYNIGNSLSGALRGLYGPLKTTWVPFAIKTAIKTKDGRQTIARMANLFVATVFLAALGLAMVGPDLIHLIGVQKYNAVADYIPLFVIPQALYGCATLFAVGIGLAKKNHYSPVIAFIGAAASIVSLLALVPAYGINGAFIALVIGATVRLAAYLLIAQKFYAIPYNWLKLGGVLAGAFLAFGLSRLVRVESAGISFFLHSSIYLCFVVITIWCLGAAKMLGESRPA